MLGAHVGDVAQVQRTILAPADDEVAQVDHRLAAGHAHGELAPADVGEARRDVPCRNDRLRQPLWGDTERGETVRIEGDLDFARAPAFQVDARNAVDAREPRLDDLFHQLLVFRPDVGHRVAGQRLDQQRAGVLGLPVVAAEHLRLLGIGRQWRKGIQTRDDVQHDAGHVGADLEGQPDTTAAAVRLGAHLDHARKSAHGLLDGLDDRLLQLGGSGLAPFRVDEELGSARVREQLDRQAQQRQHAEQQHDRRRGGDRRGVLRATLGNLHDLSLSPRY